MPRQHIAMEITNPGMAAEISGPQISCLKTFVPLRDRAILVWSCAVAVLLALAAFQTAVFGAPGQQAYLKASNPGREDFFGASVAISADTIVIGANQEDSAAVGIDGVGSDDSAVNAGAAYVFVRSGGAWFHQAYLKASNTGARDGFGLSVAIDGDTIVVGAVGEASNATGVNPAGTNNSAFQAGAAYVFVRTGTHWSQQAYLKASNARRSGQFGFAVAISGDTIVVGSRFESSAATGVNGNQLDTSAVSAGAAYVFVRHGTNWTQQAYLKASNTGGGDGFGWTVALSGDVAVIGAPNEDSSAAGIDGDGGDNTAPQAGAAYVFARVGTNWAQQAYLKASNPDGGDYFGYSVGVSGGTVVVGAYDESSSAVGVNGNQLDNSATNSGAAYVFVRNGDTWTQQAYLKASNTGPAVPQAPPFPPANDSFGLSVAIDGDIIAIGSPGESSAATGVNGDQTNDDAPGAGAAYVFVREGASWSQVAFLKASNPDSGDILGLAIAVSGGTAVVAAPSEASNAAGVNGDQTDNSVGYAGAAYVFSQLGPDLCQTVRPRLTLSRESAAGYIVRGQMAPGCSCRLQRSQQANAGWETIATLTATESGSLEFHDTSPLVGQAFYRTTQP